jgi:hypothetical protein
MFRVILILVSIFACLGVKADDLCSGKDETLCNEQGFTCTWSGVLGCVLSPGELAKVCAAETGDNCTGDCALDKKKKCMPAEKVLNMLCPLYSETDCENTFLQGLCVFEDSICRPAVVSAGNCQSEKTESKCTSSPKVCQWLGDKCAPGQQGGMVKCCKKGKRYCAGNRSVKGFKKVWKECKDVPGVDESAASVCAFVADPANCA